LVLQPPQCLGRSPLHPAIGVLQQFLEGRYRVFRLAVIAECPGSGTNLVRVPVPQLLEQVAERLFRAATFLTNQKSPEMEKGEEQSDRDDALHDDLHDAVQPVISCWQIFESTLGDRLSNHGLQCRMCPDEPISVPFALS